MPHLGATILGLVAVMHASALVFQALKHAAVAYLFYVACATWRDRSAFASDGGMAKTNEPYLVVKAFLLNILSHKPTIFFLAFPPQFVEPNAEHPLVQLLKLSDVFRAMTFVVFVAYGFRKLAIEPEKVQRCLLYDFAAAFAGLG